MYAPFTAQDFLLFLEGNYGKLEKEFSINGS